MAGGIPVIKCKNLVYLMLTRYKNNWRSSFAREMGLPQKMVEQIYARYNEEVAKEIDKERREMLAIREDEIPTAEQLIDSGMKKLAVTIASCEDPSKITRAIQTLSELKKSGDVKKEKVKSLYEIARENMTDETDETD